MKVLKWLLVLVGVAALIGAGVYTYLSWFELQKLVAVAESMRSAPQVNPQREMILSIALALGSGLALGVGLGLPRRTAGRIRKETLESSAAAREAEIRQRASGGPGDPPAGRRGVGSTGPTGPNRGSAEGSTRGPSAGPAGGSAEGSTGEPSGGDA
ncbi:hypothetical protein [Raineyella sp. W15-4]|uniref:hypothetical protein n=1 Tax=Raineyella sp. W15-4 TaxID=3081651 RepID=UPI002955D3CE|nr:hypothetical protein [Raineyella sp. W15-4]WOQ16986.1 hypothetical protein R0145_17565 [Raineyella sp. W15-4]